MVNLHLGLISYSIVYVSKLADAFEFSCGSLKVLQGAQRCNGFYKQNLKTPFENSIGLLEKILDFEPWRRLCYGDDQGDRFTVLKADIFSSIIIVSSALFT